MYNADDQARRRPPKAPVSVVLALRRERRADPPTPERDGPLRLAVCQPTNVDQVADGHLFVKWVDRISLRSAVRAVDRQDVRPQEQARQAADLHARPRSPTTRAPRPGCHGSSLGRARRGEDVDGRPALPLHRQGRRRQGPRRLRRLQRGAGAQGLPDQAHVGDRQVRHHRLAHHPQPGQDHPRQQADGLRADGRRTTRCGSSGPKIGSKQASSGRSSRSSCCRNEARRPQREGVAHEACRRAGAGRRADGRGPGRRARGVRRFVGDSDDGQASPAVSPSGPVVLTLSATPARSSSP